MKKVKLIMPKKKRREETRRLKFSRKDKGPTNHFPDHISYSLDYYYIHQTLLNKFQFYTPMFQSSKDLECTCNLLIRYQYNSILQTMDNISHFLEVNEEAQLHQCRAGWWDIPMHGYLAMHAGTTFEWSRENVGSGWKLARSQRCVQQ